MKHALVCAMASLLFACPSRVTPPENPIVTEELPDANFPRTDADAGPQVIADAPKCLTRETVTAEEAEAGKTFLMSGRAGGELLPRVVFDNLWVRWTATKPKDVPAALRERYGFSKALDDNDGLPMGMHAVGNSVVVDCLLCHGGEVAGQPVAGVANTQLDVELFVEDLTAIAKLMGREPEGAPKIRTGAKGVSDIVGMTMQLGLRQVTPPEPINTEVGFQDPPAWWTLGDKTRMYTDGSSPQRAHRSNMATQMAFGTSQAGLEALEPDYILLRKYLTTLKPPVWPFEAPDRDAVERGRVLYRQMCTGCHRDDRCEKAESVVVARETVGTDPERSLRYTEKEIALLNASYFGSDGPHTATNGYVAPSLRGVWASAPYFHNGSVPTLEGVLNSSKRPKLFRILGTQAENYDTVNVGLKVETLDALPANLPRAKRSWYYDTSKVGLRNTGHTFADALSERERRDLLDFLKTW